MEIHAVEKYIDILKPFCLHQSLYEAAFKYMNKNNISEIMIVIKLSEIGFKCQLDLYQKAVAENIIDLKVFLLSNETEVILLNLNFICFNCFKANLHKLI